MGFIINLLGSAAARAVEFTVVALGTATGQVIYVIIDEAYKAGMLDGVPIIKEARKREELRNKENNVEIKVITIEEYEKWKNETTA